MERLERERAEAEFYAPKTSRFSGDKSWIERMDQDAKRRISERYEQQMARELHEKRLIEEINSIKSNILKH